MILHTTHSIHSRSLMLHIYIYHSSSPHDIAMVSWNNSAPDQVLFGRLFEEICSLSDFLRSTRFGMGIQWGYEMVYTQLCVCIYICIIMYNYMYNYMCTKSPRKKKTWYKGGKKKTLRIDDNTPQGQSSSRN